MTTMRENIRESVVRENVIVAGVDGSAMSTTAALWAAAECVRRNASLHIVSAFTVPVAGFAGPGSMPLDVYDASLEATQAVVAQAAEIVRSAHPDLDIVTEVFRDQSVAALLHCSEKALMTVVGSHGRHQFTDAVLGSVAVRMAARATRPVVVVRHPELAATDTEEMAADGTPLAADGPVLVGVDGSDDAQAAIGFAFEEAAVRETQLIAVHSWDDVVLDGFLRAYPLPINKAEVDEERRRLLAEQLAGWSEKYPEVHVRPEIRRGHPVAALLGPSPVPAPGDKPPALIVVGTRGHGRFAGLLLGSTSQALIAHAPCPVAVVGGHHHR